MCRAPHGCGSLTHPSTIATPTSAIEPSATPWWAWRCRAIVCGESHSRCWSWVSQVYPTGSVNLPVRPPSDRGLLRAAFPEDPIGGPAAGRRRSRVTTSTSSMTTPAARIPTPSVHAGSPWIRTAHW